MPTYYLQCIKIPKYNSFFLYYDYNIFYLGLKDIYLKSTDRNDSICSSKVPKFQAIALFCTTI